MFRWASTILLLLIVLLQVAGKWLVFADYALNKAYIARTLCVNKSKPAMHCKGQCHLRKQLQKEENGGEQAPNHSSHQKFQEVFFEPHTPVALTTAVQYKTETIPQNTILYTSRYIASIFHPPGIV
jgi:hypothetical protein